MIGLVIFCTDNDSNFDFSTVNTVYKERTADSKVARLQPWPFLGISSNVESPYAQKANQ